MTTVFLGADHRGFQQKESLKTGFDDSFTLTDLTPATPAPTDDFNDPAIAVARAVLAQPGSFGILLCGSSHGVCIQANRFRGIRAISGFNADSIIAGRQHDDANILCLSADQLSPQQIAEFAQVFLTTPFSGAERYVRRRERLDQEPEL